MNTVLHVAPHPDDESLGAPCTLLALAAAGVRVVIATAGLGRRSQHVRRRAELAAAVRVGGFELRVPDRPVPLASTDDLVAAQEAVEAWLGALIEELRPSVVVGPHPHDAHPAHEAVARAIAARSDVPVWWSWGIWAEVREPSLLVPCEAGHMERARAMLACHVGELDRNDYRAMFESTRRLAAVRGGERILGFGLPRPRFDYAELLGEHVFRDGRWLRGAPRLAESSTILRHPEIRSSSPMRG